MEFSGFCQAVGRWWIQVFVEISVGYIPRGQRLLRGGERTEVLAGFSSRPPKVGFRRARPDDGFTETQMVNQVDMDTLRTMSIKYKLPRNNCPLFTCFSLIPANYQKLLIIRRLF